MRRALLLAVVAAMLGGCSSDDGKRAPGPDDPVDALVTVPPVVGQDAVNAAQSVGRRGFKVVFEDLTGLSSNAPQFAGCNVTAQEPPGNAKARPGADVTLQVDCRERDWEAQKGDAWDEFATAYFKGFDVGCTRLFKLTATGLLNDGGTDLFLRDCKHLKPDDAGAASTVPAELPQDPKAAGRRYGIDDGCKALFDDRGVRELAAGDGAAVVTASDCRNHGAKTDEIHTCDPTDGLEITPRAGAVDCVEAVQVWEDYEKNATSGGSQAPGDWKCVSAAKTDAPALGQCANRDGRVFTVATAGP